MRKVTNRWLIEEGAAFAELEADLIRAIGQTERTRPMSKTQRPTTSSEQQHWAPMEAWNAIADAYDRYVTAGEEPLATAALQLAGLRAGDRFLDVAAGTGGLALPATSLGARVVATDWSPRMIDQFNARVSRDQLANAEGRVMDCHDLDFADNSFDVTGSQFGVMLVPNQPRALREMVRVTRPGGRVLLIAYGDPSQFEAIQFFIAALRTVTPGFEGLPDEPTPLEFQNADPLVLAERLSDAGLGNVSVDTSLEERVALRNGEDLWNWCLGSNPIPGMLVADLSEPQKAEVRAELDESIRRRAGATERAILTAPINIGIGTK